MFLTHDPTQPTKKLKISTQPNPAQPNPTRGSTQPMDNSVLTRSPTISVQRSKPKNIPSPAAASYL